MIKKIKCFLLTFVALGFLQLESSAMDEEDFRKGQNAIIRWSATTDNRITALEKIEQETSVRVNKDLTQIREDNASFKNEIGLRITQESTSIDHILKRMQQQSEEIITLQEKINPLLQENETLRRKVGELQEQLNPSRPLKATLKNSYSSTEWKAYTTPGQYVPITFEDFAGDPSMQGENKSVIKIPEDGIYSLYAHYHCQATNDGPTDPYICIIINNNADDRNINHFVHHHLAPGYLTSDGLNRITRLKKDDKVMLSIWGSKNAKYYLANSQLEVEKIH